MSISLRVSLFLFALSLLGLAVSGQVIYARLAYLWIFLIGSSFFLARTALAGVELRRTARVERAEVGQVFEEVFTIYNPSRIPKLWLAVLDKSDLPGNRASRVLTLIGGRRSRTFVTRTRLISRGVIRLGPTELRSGDLFGLFSSYRSIPSTRYLMVYPRIIDLFQMPNPPGLLPGGEAVSRRTHQITPNAATVRDYASGDPLSKMHWPSVARRNRLIVKEFELDPLAEVWIFVDAQQAVHSSLPYKMESDPGSVIFQRGGPTRLKPSTEEYSATLAASLAEHYLLAGRTVGYAVAGLDPLVLSAERGVRQLNKIIESTALFTAKGQVRFVDFTLQQSRNLPRGSTLYLITPSTNDEILLLVEQLWRLGQRAFVLLLDAASFGGREGSRLLRLKLNSSGIPTAVISEGQDLAVSLGNLRISSMIPLVA